MPMPSANTAPPKTKSMEEGDNPRHHYCYRPEEHQNAAASPNLRMVKPNTSHLNR